MRLCLRSFLTAQPYFFRWVLCAISLTGLYVSYCFLWVHTHNAPTGPYKTVEVDKMKNQKKQHKSGQSPNVNHSGQNGQPVQDGHQVQADAQSQNAQPAADRQNQASDTNQNTASQATTQNVNANATTPHQQQEELKQQLQRLAADYQNYQKRASRMVEQAHQMAKADVIKSILSVLDNFEHTLEKGTQTQDAGTLLEGVKIVYDHLVKVLESAGLQRINVQPGDVFDPNVHEAMLREPNDTLPAGTIVRELAHGYLINERVLRPAKVSVAIEAQPQNQNQTANQPEKQKQTGKSQNN